MEHIYSVPTNVSTFVPLTLLEAFTPFPHYYQVATNGYSGHGLDWPRLVNMWPSIFFAIVFTFCRIGFKKTVFKWIAKSLKLSAKKTERFCYQMWLLTFYVTSSVYGLVALWDKEWLAFPPGHNELYALFSDSPFIAGNDIQFYYSYAIGFYIAELIAIFVEIRRADFLEYLLHHVVTLYLIVFSWIGYETRFGAFILLIHDISDIPLCTAKIWHYVGGSKWSINVHFAAFIGAFVYMRLICLPTLTYGLYCYSTKMRPLWGNFIFLAFFVGIVLQALHIFWFYLVIRMVHRLICGGKGDVRSEDEVSDDEDGSKKAEGKKGGESKKKINQKAAAAAAGKASSATKPKQD